MIELRPLCRMAGWRFGVPMSGRHVRRVFDEWCHLPASAEPMA